MSTVSEARRGFFATLGAYILWGFLPLYFPLLVPATALDISAHRVLWSWVICLILLAATGTFSQFTTLMRDRRRAARLALAAILLSANWLIFLIGVLTGRVVETSLGYFLNPLFTVVLAVVVLGESINRTQLIGLAVAAVGMVVLVVETATFPWISISLAFSFGLYGLIKKQVSADVGALPGFAVETTALLPLAIGYLAYIVYAGSNTFGVATGPLGTRTDHVALMMFAGVATTTPLLLFAGGTRRIPLVTIGMIQFVTPIMQFLTGVFIYNEEMSAGRWIGFIGVWLALIIVSFDAVRKFRSRPKPGGLA